MFSNDKTIKEITIKSGDQEIKLENVSSLTIGNFIITPRIMYDINQYVGISLFRRYGQDDR